MMLSKIKWLPVVAIVIIIGYFSWGIHQKEIAEKSKCQQELLHKHNTLLQENINNETQIYTMPNSDFNGIVKRIS